ncbi:MAG TPA: tyrosine-type recombinase/integrase [Solirubrobacteraceae bacterium]|nr:tyrosine-type recombinase/integrase [Solirubrobacteraceae bacterium]
MGEESQGRPGPVVGARMWSARPIAPSGHVFRVERRRGPVWYAKYRLPDARQVQRKLGPAWSGRGRPPAGYFTKRLAEEALRAILEEARRGTLPGTARTGVSFAGVAAEYMRHLERDRELKPSTLRGYRSILRAYLLPAFGERLVETITTAEVESWRDGLQPAAITAKRQAPGASALQLSNSTKTRILTLLHGIFAFACKRYGLTHNPVTPIERLRSRSAGGIEVLSPEEVWALVRAAQSEQDRALFLSAAFTGLRRGELLALRWRDVDFDRSTVRVRASYAGGALTSPKSGKLRSVPLAPDVAVSLQRLRRREHFTAEDDLVFIGETGSYLDASALRRRYKAALVRAGLRPLRFHDLRHTFGTRMIAKADIRRVQEWMGHADIQTTMRYLHYAPREEDARLVAEAFRMDAADEMPMRTTVAPPGDTRQS